MVNGLRAWPARPALKRMNAESAALSERSTALERRLTALEPKTSQLQRDVTRLSACGRRGTRPPRGRCTRPDGLSRRPLLHALRRGSRRSISARTRRGCSSPTWSTAGSTRGHGGSRSRASAKGSTSVGGSSPPHRPRAQLPHRLPRELESLGAERTLAVATSAVRDAENGEAFLGEIEWSYGFATRLLSGHDEALLTLREHGRPSARSEHADRRRRRRLDRARARRAGRRLLHTSLDFGCVRLTERFGDDLEACAEDVRSERPTSSHGARSASQAR